MEPDDILVEDDSHYRSDDEEDDIEQNASQNADEETGCPVVSLEVPSWLQIDSSGIDEDDYTYLNPFIKSSPTFILSKQPRASGRLFHHRNPSH